MVVAAPSFTTERLAFRAHELGDLPDVEALWADPVVTRHIGGRPFTAEETWHKVLRNVGHWALQGFGYWVVHERATGAFVGEVGLADLHREITPSLRGLPEAGWVLSPAAHGRGYATEAVSAVLAWGEAHLSAPRTVCIIDPDNTASRRVAHKCGFVQVADTTYHGAPALPFEPRPG